MREISIFIPLQHFVNTLRPDFEARTQVLLDETPGRVPYDVYLLNETYKGIIGKTRAFWRELIVEKIR